jgi:hypothetical protein
VIARRLSEISGATAPAMQDPRRHCTRYVDVRDRFLMTPAVWSVPIG